MEGLPICQHPGMSTATIHLGDELSATLERLAKERSVTVESHILALVEGPLIDKRHFRAVRPRHRESLTLLP